MGKCRIPSLARALSTVCLLTTVFQAKADDAKSDAEPISMVVMDPLALPLSCPCVAGYAQRKYEVLGDYLSKQLGRPVVVTFAESIKNALDKESVDDVHLIIGKDSDRHLSLNIAVGRLIGSKNTASVVLLSHILSVS